MNETVKKIVIAGGSGFLGRKLSEYFNQEGYQVIIKKAKVRDRSVSRYA